MEMIKEWLFQSYQFLASIKVPGFSISFIQLFFGVFAVVVSIGYARMFFGLGGDVVRAVKQKGGNNKNIKVSNERKGDRR